MHARWVVAILIAALALGGSGCGAPLSLSSDVPTAGFPREATIVDLARSADEVAALVRSGGRLGVFSWREGGWRRRGLDLPHLHGDSALLVESPSGIPYVVSLGDDEACVQVAADLQTWQVHHLSLGTPDRLRRARASAGTTAQSVLVALRSDLGSSRLFEIDPAGAREHLLPAGSLRLDLLEGSHPPAYRIDVFDRNRIADPFEPARFEWMGSSFVHRPRGFFAWGQMNHGVFSGPERSAHYLFEDDVTTGGVPRPDALVRWSPLSGTSRIELPFASHLAAELGVDGRLHALRLSRGRLELIRAGPREEVEPVHSFEVIGDPGQIEQATMVTAHDGSWIVSWNEYLLVGRTRLFGGPRFERVPPAR